MDELCLISFNHSVQIFHKNIQDKTALWLVSMVNI